MKFNNKNILIIGASQGIGEGIAIELAQKGKNRIAIVSRRLSVLQEVAKKIEAKGSKALAIEADALDQARAVEVVKEVVDKFGSIDLAILVVGGAPPVLTYEARVETVHNIMELNYHSMANYFKPVVEQMKAQGGGLIAHMNSLAGFLPLPILGPYAASKAAARVFLTAARAELLPDNIRISILCPGFIRTEGLGGVDPKPMPVMEVPFAAKKMVNALEKEKRLYRFPFSLSFSIGMMSKLPYFIQKPVFQKLLKMNLKAMKKTRK
jgi:short-subunit dehydrogenase